MEQKNIHMDTHRWLNEIFQIRKDKYRKAICKPWHWNLGIENGIGIGIGIGTDTINAIIYSSTRSMDTKPSRVMI